MNLTEKRAELAAALQAALAGTKWFPMRPSGGVRDMSGWLVLTEISSADATHGMLTASFRAILSLGTDLDHAQAKVDELIIPFHEAFGAPELGCWGYTATPDTVNVGGSDLFVLTATLLTEVEAS